MKMLSSLILIVTVGFFSCKSSSQAMSSDEVIPNPNKKNSTESAMNDDITYDLIISFISKGAGIDYKLKEKIDAVIVDFNTKNKLKLKAEKLNWGREGETDYNFVLKNLSTDQKKSFISNIEETIGSSDMVHLTFNQKSVHKR